uniref:Uncharacterized protein n=1 Tax=Nymphaea colorata TaxID=210225 RepID=A0A5K1GV70_9MAGN
MPAALPFTRPPMAIMPPFNRTSVISAKFQKRYRRSPRNDPDDDSDKMGGVGFAVLTAMESGRSQRKGDSSDFPLPGTSLTGGAPSRDGKRDRQKEMASKKSETGTNNTESTSLSGHDVLLALQSASAQKASLARRRRGSKQKGTTLTEESRLNPDDIRPIIIKSDWAARLRKLENLLEDLTMDDV